MSPKIAIVGGGPCGLTLARLLERNKISYTIYERDTAIQEKGQGGTLDLHSNTGLEALRQAGLFDEFDKLARWDASSIGFANGFSGETFFRFGGEDDRKTTDKDSEHARPEIDRRQLRQLLLNALPEENIRWGSGIVSVDKDESKSWRISFADGSIESGFDLIVGADGAWSKVRPALTSAKPFYSGKHFIEARISKENLQYTAAREMVGPGNFVVFSGGNWLSIQQMSDESYRVYIGIQVPADYAQSGNLVETEKVRDEYLASPQYYLDWSQKFKDIIAYCEGPFRAWPLYSLQAEEVDWPRIPGATLIGDAAHVTVPDGEGVNRAMYDALVLAENIVKYQSEDSGLDKAVAEYEREMFPRVRKGIEEALGGLEMMFSEDAVERVKKWTAEMAAQAQGNLEG